MIRFACPICKAVLQSADTSAGATVTCPSCKHLMHILGPHAPAHPPAPHRSPPHCPAPAPHRLPHQATQGAVRAQHLHHQQHLAPAPPAVAPAPTPARPRLARGPSWPVLVAVALLCAGCVLGLWINLNWDSFFPQEPEERSATRSEEPDQPAPPQTTRPAQSPEARTTITPERPVSTGVNTTDTRPHTRGTFRPTRSTPDSKPGVRPTTNVKLAPTRTTSPTVVPRIPEPGPVPKPESVAVRTANEIYQTATPPVASPLPGASRINELVLGKLKEKGISPAAPCSDGVFLRRVYLDVIGTLPTAQEAQAFLKDSDPNKRQVLIDRLLERKEFADYWAMKWGDLLRVKSEFPINLWPNAVRAYHQWIRASLRENLPYDQFARALLTSSGSNFRTPPVNFYRAVQKKDAPTISQAVALTFMGVRPEGLSTERWSGMATFFSQVGYKPTREWKEEIVYFDPRKPLKAGEAVFPDGVKASLLPDQDPRGVFADWLIAPQNPWFTRNIANRVWSWLMGRGIIHEPDDIRPTNPPSHPELLVHLEQELIAARYDLKHLFRVILNSKPYQFSCVAGSEHAEAAALFAAYPVRRLEAEVLIDALCQITGTTEKYYSPIPEPFTYLPQGHRAISLPDASISSSFLEMFGRPPRDTGLEAERNNNLTAGQRLHLLNSAHIQRKIERGPGLSGLIGSGKPPREVVEELYLTILSRYPTRDELAAVEDYGRGGMRGRRMAFDIAWALINSAEFLCRH